MNDVIPTGSRILPLRKGHVYGLTNRPGLYVLLQFDSTEVGTVQEQGSGTIHVVQLADLKPIAKSSNPRTYDLETLDKEKREVLEQRFKAIEPLISFRRVPKAKLEECASKSGNAPKTLRKWLRQYQRDPRLSSLGRKRRDDANKSRFDGAIEKELKKAIDRLLADGNMTLDQVHKDLADDLKVLAKKHGWKRWKTPSYGTVYNRYRSISEKDKAEAKYGSRPARLQYGITRGSLADVDHPLSIVQVDHLEMPVVVVDDEDRHPIGKAWVTVLIDIWSRCICGFYLTLESPGDLSLGMAMTHAILPKAKTLKLLDFEATWPVSGFPWAVHADNAGEFQGNMLELAAQEYSFELLFRKVREPNYGGHIEAYLGTLSHQIRRLPGSTREGPESLGENDPNDTAAMTLAEVERYVVSLIVEYHNTPHSGLGGLTPLAKFQAGMRGTSTTMSVGEVWHAEDPERLKIDFLPCTTRTVQPRGIVWDKIEYVDDCLQRWVHSRDPKNISEKREFLVRRDPRDITRIYFLDPELNAYKIIGTRNISRPRMSLWELRAATAWLKAQGRSEIDEEMIFKARAMRKSLQKNSVAATAAAQRKRARQEQREREWGKNANEASDTAPPATPPVSQVTAESSDAADVKDSVVIGKAYKGGW
jgi:putative transposase